MRILLLGEASFVHSTLRKGFEELGHDVVLMSDGNHGRGCPRDVDLERDMTRGKLGGLTVLWRLLKNARRLFGNDIVQIHNYQFVPLKPAWNKALLFLLKIGNKRVIKCCLGDDCIVFDGQRRGILAYSDTHIGTRPINVEENRWRIEEQYLPEYVDACRYANSKADLLLPCLYEYYRYYDLPEYHDKLRYFPLPIEIPAKGGISDDKRYAFAGQKTVDGEVKDKVRVLVGIQKERDYIKGAAYVGRLVEQVAREFPDRIEVRTVSDVPYTEYLSLLDRADVQVDQLYSYTPSMNSIAAMAHGTVVIGGGEEEYYDFIGEPTLRPIINVRPGDDDYNLAILRRTLPFREKIEELKRQGLLFVRKHHDYLKVCKQIERLKD